MEGQQIRPALSRVPGSYSAGSGSFDPQIAGRQLSEYRDAQA
jgi:hypothetical protein